MCACACVCVWGGFTGAPGAEAMPAKGGLIMGWPIMGWLIMGWNRRTESIRLSAAQNSRAVGPFLHGGAKEGGIVTMIKILNAHKKQIKIVSFGRHFYHTTYQLGKKTLKYAYIKKKVKLHASYLIHSDLQHIPLKAIHVMKTGGNSGCGLQKSSIVS